MRTLYLILQGDCGGEVATPWDELHASPEAALAKIQLDLTETNTEGGEGYENLYPIPDAWGFIQSDEAIATFKREFRNAQWAMAFDEFVLTLHRVEGPE